MAKVRVSKELIEDLVFGYSSSPVRIVDLRVDYDNQVVVFDVEGLDVPDTSEVRCIARLQQNRAGQRLLTMTFEPLQ